MKRCLVIDDSSVIRKVARALLNSLGYEVIEAASGADGIAACAERVEAALEIRSLDAMAAAMNEEWRLRRELAPVVSNERIEELIAAAMDAGALAAKVCGAGGGGCLAVIAEDRAIGDALPTGIDTRGLVVGYRK